MLERPLAAERAHLADAKTLAAFLAPLSKKRGSSTAKQPFAGPRAVLAYLSRHTWMYRRAMTARSSEPRPRANNLPIFLVPSRKLRKRKEIHSNLTALRSCFCYCAARALNQLKS
jgi:hypothetical protein